MEKRMVSNGIPWQRDFILSKVSLSLSPNDGNLGDFLIRISELPRFIGNLRWVEKFL